MFLLWGKIMFLFILILIHLPQFGQQPRGNYKIKFMKSKNFTGKKFQNKDGITTNMNFFKIIPLLPKWMSAKGEKKPSREILVMQRNKEEFEGLDDSLVRLTWFGHSAFLLEIDGKRLLIDPDAGSCFITFSNF